MKKCRGASWRTTLYFLLLIFIGCSQNQNRNVDLTFVKNEVNKYIDDKEYDNAFIFITTLADSFPSDLQLKNMIADFSVRASAQSLILYSNESDREKRNKIIQQWKKYLLRGLTECDSILIKQPLYVGEFPKYNFYPVSIRLLKEWIEKDIERNEYFNKDIDDRYVIDDLILQRKRITLAEDSLQTISLQNKVKQAKGN